MVKVLFICHGNICRSAMAEFMLRDMAQKRNLPITVFSRAVSREELGNPVYPPARRKLAQHNISCAGHRAAQVTKGDILGSDYIFYMDDSNRRYLQRMFPDLASRCQPLLPRDVADPWYTGDFETTWQDLLEGCEAICREVGR